MGRRIIITSGKGGVGKTTVTANIGYALASRGHNVVLLDGDIGLNNLDVMLRAEDKIMYDIGDAVTGKADLSRCLVEIADGLFLLPSVTAVSSMITKQSFRDICKVLAESFDYVFIDSPAGVEESFMRAAAGAEEGIIIATPHIASVRDGYKTSKILQGLGIHTQGLVINRIRGDLVADNSMLDAKEIASAVRLPLYGVVPEDDAINIMGLADRNEKRNACAYSYGLLADYIEGKDKKIYDYLAPYRGFFGRFIKKTR